MRSVHNASLLARWVKHKSGYLFFHLRVVPLVSGPSRCSLACDGSPRGIDRVNLRVQHCVLSGASAVRRSEVERAILPDEGHV